MLGMKFIQILIKINIMKILLNFLKKIRPNIEIVITERNRDENFNISWYSQTLKQGGCLLFEDFKKKVKEIMSMIIKKDTLIILVYILNYEDLKNDQNLY